MNGPVGFTGWVGTVLGTPDPAGLGRFYAGLMGGDLDTSDPSFVTLHREGTAVYLAFQLEPDHTPPRWPGLAGEQQMQMHLDIGVLDLQPAIAQAVRLGATEAASQPQADVRVLLDPAGHPFCLFRDRG